MAIANTRETYGSVSRVFHWLTALLILTAIPLGFVANAIPFETDAQVAQKTVLFSLHKTVGVSVFFVALARILWAIVQPRPAPLHPDRRIETFLAASAHWILYAALVLVPLSGWLHHAATTGFAPIWWPFGQSLPFVPVDFRVAEFFSAWHWVFTRILAAVLLLHVAGALKHAWIDRDATLARMWRGSATPVQARRDSAAPAAIAFAVWMAAVAGGSALGWPDEDEASDRVAPSAAAWLVEDGTLSISIRQLETEITGSFTDWIAVIEFDETSESDFKGSVDVSVVVGSLTLGDITTQALGPDFLDSTPHPLASFSGPIVEDPAGDGYVVFGSLSLKGTEFPLELPFELRLDDDRATAEAQVTLDRRTFGIGDGIDDPKALGFDVQVDVTLSASRP